MAVLGRTATRVVCSHNTRTSEEHIRTSVHERVLQISSNQASILGTVHSRGSAKSEVLIFSTNKAIVETNTDSKLFLPHDVDGVMQRRALCTFKAITDYDSSNGERDAYLEEIKSVMRFQLAVRLVPPGGSLPSVSRQHAVIREETGMAEYGVASDVTTSNYV